MNCAQVDLKGFLLGELGADERRLCEEHLRECSLCQEEMERLQVTRNALASWPEEAPPQRIAFVSDKVFEPRWWRRVPGWVLTATAVAIVLLGGYSFRKPGPTPPVDMAGIEARIQSEVDRRLAAAVEKAVAESELRQEARFKKALAEAEKRWDFERRADMLAVEENFILLRKQMNRMYVASSELGGPR